MINILEEKQTRLESASQALRKEIVLNLKQLSPRSDSTTVRQYEGDDGVKFVLKDILRTVSKQGDKHYRVYSSKLIRKYLYRPLPNFTRLRVQKNIRVNVIAMGEGGDCPTAAVIGPISNAHAMALSFDTLWERL